MRRSFVGQITEEHVLDVMRSNWARSGSTHGHTIEGAAAKVFASIDTQAVAAAAAKGTSPAEHEANGREEVERQLVSLGAMAPRMGSALRTVTYSVASLSSAHIPYATALALDQQLDAKDGSLWHTLSYARSGETGWQVYATQENVTAARDAGFDDLAALIDTCVKHDLDRIELDRDNLIVEGLSYFDWEREGFSPPSVQRPHADG